MMINVVRKYIDGVKMTLFFYITFRSFIYFCRHGRNTILH